MNNSNLIFGLSATVVEITSQGCKSRNPTIPSQRLNIPSERSNAPSERPFVDSLRPNIPTQRPNIPSRRLNLPSQRLNVPSRRLNIPSKRPNVDSKRPNVDSKRVNTDSKRDNLAACYLKTSKISPNYDKTSYNSSLPTPFLQKTKPEQFEAVPVCDELCGMSCFDSIGIIDLEWYFRRPSWAFWENALPNRYKYPRHPGYCFWQPISLIGST